MYLLQIIEPFMEKPPLILKHPINLLTLFGHIITHSVIGLILRIELFKG